MKLLVLIPFLISFTFPRSLNGIDFTWSYPYGNVVKQNIGAFSLAYLTPNPKLTGFLEFGFTAMPEISWDKKHLKGETSTLSFMGVYTGHLFLMFRGLIRPGFQIGSVYETRADYLLEDGELIRRGDGETASFKPYFAFKLQALFFTFLFSNKAVGGGINLSI